MIPLSPITLQKAATEYTNNLLSFAQAYTLTKLLTKPIDHIAIKAQDAIQYETWVQAIEHYAKKLSFTHLNNRRIATAVLLEPILIGTVGSTSYLEIMEPKPEKIGSDFVGLEHTELYVPNFSPVENVLQKQLVSYKKQKSNRYHETLVVQINTEGQQVKFTNNPLAHILEQEAHDQHIIYIKN